MRRPRTFRGWKGSPRLVVQRRGERSELWTEAVGRPPPVYGERWTEVQGRSYRSFDPFRSKLAAAVVKGWTGDLPREGDAWLYLGAASGTTASHVADLVGPHGRVYGLERSPRPFARLLAVAQRWPNLLPVLADAREPETYFSLVPEVDGVYVDLAQPDQVAIALANAATFLRGDGGRLLLALKTASMGREAGPREHLARAEETLAELLDEFEPVALEPFHRGHYFVGGRARGSLFAEPGESPVSPRRERPRARPRR